MNNPGYRPCLERCVWTGAVSEPRREIEQTVAPLRHMSALRPLVALWILAALFVGWLVLRGVWGLS